MKARLISSRLLSNAVTTYLRLGSTFLIGLFTTWYILGALGSLGFGLVALAFASSGISHSLERTLRIGIVRQLAKATADGDPHLLRGTVASALRLCLQVAVPLIVFSVLLAAVAFCGVFDTASPRLDRVLAVLILAEGFYALTRLLTAPWIQTLYAAQRVGLDNLLSVLGRALYALSAVLVFGVWLREASISTQLLGFALSRVTLQLADAGLGFWLARRALGARGEGHGACRVDLYRGIRHTVWHSSQVSIFLNVLPLALAVLINLFFGLVYNSLWQVVVQYTGYAWMIGEGLLRGLSPLTTHLQRQGREKLIRELVVRSVRYQWAVVLPAALVLGVLAGPLLQLWVGSRLASDPALQAEALSPSSALELAAAMAWWLLAARVARAGFYGVETTLYGLGKLGACSWAAKWSLGLSLTLAVGIFATTQDPMGAPVSMLAGTLLFSPFAVLRAAGRELGLSVMWGLLHAVSRPLVSSLFIVPLLFAARLTGSAAGAFIWLAAAGLVYLALGWVWVLSAGERARLLEMGRRSRPS